MGNFIGFSDTQFVGVEEMGAVSSYQPCHAFGDSMLIGLGIRVGFYLFYVAAIVAVLCGVHKHFRIWNASFTVIALATFIGLCLNSTGANLLVVDWTILIQLILWFPVFFFTQVFRRHTLTITAADGRQACSLDQIQTRLAEQRQQAVAERDAAGVRAYVDALKAFAAHAAAVEAEADYDAARDRLAGALTTYRVHWCERVEVVDGARREVEEVDIDGGFTAAAYRPDVVREVAAAPTRADVDALRDNYIAALVHAELSAEHARETEALAAQIAAEELRIRRRAMKPKQAASFLLWATTVKDKIAAALALLVWSAYMFATPALWFRLVDGGRKQGCDDYIQVFFVFKGMSPWEPGFQTFLKIFACGSIVVAILVVLFALYLITVGIFGSRARGRSKWKPGRGPGGAHHGRKQQHQHQQPPRDVEAGEGYVAAGDSDHVHDAPSHSYTTRRRHADEVLGCIHGAHETSNTTTGDSTTTTTRRHSRHDRRAPPSSKSFYSTGAVHFDLFSIPWAILLAVLLVETIATLEVMVIHDRLDFVRPNLHETAEILVFLVGLLILILVLWTVVEGLFRLFFRKTDRGYALRRRRQRQRQHRRADHHPQGGSARQEETASREKLR